MSEAVSVVVASAHYCLAFVCWIINSLADKGLCYVKHSESCVCIVLVVGGIHDWHQCFGKTRRHNSSNILYICCQPHWCHLWHNGERSTCKSAVCVFIYWSL